MANINGNWIIIILLLVISVAACSMEIKQEPLPDTTDSPIITPTTWVSGAIPTPTYEPTANTPVPEISPLPETMSGSIGIGLRRETVDILLENKECGGLTMAASPQVAESYFPKLEGWVRVLGAPSLEELDRKAKRLRTNEIPYEGLSYGLEASKSTPEEEWQNLIKSTQLALDLANTYGKLLVMGPGYQLMSLNEDKYAPMGSLADVWILQTQQLQKEPPGLAYREEVERIVTLIRSDNSDIDIWAQITLPPDRKPDAAEWLQYRQLIADLVDGTYLGVYTWDVVNNDELISTITTIFGRICGENKDQ